jgi:hypothetical protein
MIANEQYKGFNVEFDICRKGFNQYSITIKKNTKDNKYYFFKLIQTITNKKAIARKEALKYIDNLKFINWAWNGIKTYNPKTDKINRIEVLK